MSSSGLACPRIAAAEAAFGTLNPGPTACDDVSLDEVDRPIVEVGTGAGFVVVAVPDGLVAHSDPPTTMDQVGELLRIDGVAGDVVVGLTRSGKFVAECHFDLGAVDDSLTYTIVA